MRFVTLNLRSGGGARVEPLVEAIGRYDADVLVLTEFRSGSNGERLEGSLAELGYAYRYDPSPPSRTNSVLVASRTEAIALEFPDADRHLAGCAISGLTIIGVYMPQTREKERYWRETILPLAERLVATETILIGDFNTGDERDREVSTPFFAEAELAQFLAMGWTDAWRELHPDAREFTWYSHANNGFLLDHAYLSPSLRDSLLTAQLSHREREERITDHSALIVDLSIRP